MTPLQVNALEAAVLRHLAAAPGPCDYVVLANAADCIPNSVRKSLQARLMQHDPPLLVVTTHGRGAGHLLQLTDYGRAQVPGLQVVERRGKHWAVRRRAATYDLEPLPTPPPSVYSLSKHQLRQLWGRLGSRRALAEYLQTTQATVRRRLQGCRKPPGPTPLQRLAWQCLYHRPPGQVAQHAADRLGVQPHTARRLLREYRVATGRLPGDLPPNYYPHVMGELDYLRTHGTTRADAENAAALTRLLAGPLVRRIDAGWALDLPTLIGDTHAPPS